MLKNIRSALLVDFDNIYGVLDAKIARDVAKWVAWFEDGALSPSGRGRKFLTRRVYWNAQFDRYRGIFESAGFEAFSCRALAINKLKAGKSTADVFITMDSIELAERKASNQVEEIIILAADSDYVPLVNRLQTKGLRVVTAGRESDFTLALYREHADAVVHMTALEKACDYERGPRRMFGLLPPRVVVADVDPEREAPQPKPDVASNAQERGPEGRPDGSPSPAVAPTSMSVPEVRQAKARGAKAPSTKTRAWEKGASARYLEEAADIVAGLGAETPDQLISRGKIIRALETHPWFNMNPAAKGAPTWIGTGSYAAMIPKIAAANPNLMVRKFPNGGACLLYRPTSPAELPASPPAV